MSFTLIDKSRIMGSPFILMLFRHGENGERVHGYTNNESEIVFDDITYEPVPLESDSIRSRGANGKNEFSVKLPNSSEVSKLFRFFPPPNPVSLVIYQGHRTDVTADYQVVWTGRVLSAKPGANLQTVFSCESGPVSMRRVGATRNWQKSCPLPLYGPDCRADKVAASVVAPAAGVLGTRLTLSPGWTNPTLYPKYANGSVSWSTINGIEHRAIIEVSSAGVLSLSNRAVGLEPGALVTVSLGCNRLTSDCRDLHNNILNFGGQPWLPDENPIGKDIY